MLTLKLPVHKRIGTQFKCFADVKDAQHMVQARALLENCDRIRDVTVSKGIHSNRIYFILDRFGETTTIDGLKNNIVFPE